MYNKKKTTLKILNDPTYLDDAETISVDTWKQILDKASTNNGDTEEITVTKSGVEKTFKVQIYSLE
jgi:hypothetical protein